MPTDQPSLGHLWFLYYPLYFYLLIPICFVVSRWPETLNLGWVIASPLFCAALYFRGGVLFEGFIFIKPHPPSLL
jgi:surface polysaccharide O-acyltransferase-like enzyme